MNLKYNLVFLAVLCSTIFSSAFARPMELGTRGIIVHERTTEPDISGRTIIVEQRSAEELSHSARGIIVEQRSAEELSHKARAIIIHEREADAADSNTRGEIPDYGSAEDLSRS